jgi:hypothetical protein
LEVSGSAAGRPITKAIITKTTKLLVHAALGVVFALTAAAQSVLPKPPEPFKGIVDLRAKQSKPDFPQPVKAPVIGAGL